MPFHRKAARWPGRRNSLKPYEIDEINGLRSDLLAYFCRSHTIRNALVCLPQTGLAFESNDRRPDAGESYRNWKRFGNLEEKGSVCLARAN